MKDKRLEIILSELTKEMRQGFQNMKLDHNQMWIKQLNMGKKLGIILDKVTTSIDNEKRQSQFNYRIEQVLDSYDTRLKVLEVREEPKKKYDPSGR